MLKEVQEFFQDLEKKAFKLTPRSRWHVWSLLTALRGPDSGNKQLKEVTTARIRKKILPKLARYCGADTQDGEVDLDWARDQAPQAHFLTHVRYAKGALDGTPEVWDVIDRVLRQTILKPQQVQLRIKPSVRKPSRKPRGKVSARSRKKSTS